MNPLALEFIVGALLFLPLLFLVVVPVLQAVSLSLRRRKFRFTVSYADRRVSSSDVFWSAVSVMLTLGLCVYLSRVVFVFV